MYAKKDEYGIEARPRFKRCRETCNNCREKPSHGPYWYGYGYTVNEKTGQRTKRVNFGYFGRSEPSYAKMRERWHEWEKEQAAKQKAKEQKPPKGPSAAGDDAERFTYSRMSRGAALRILGLTDGYSRDALRAAVRSLTKLYHPDRKKPAERERATEITSAINSAADFLGRDAGDTFRGTRRN